MQYKCETCQDTGDKDKDSGELGYLNCPDCDAPMQRAALNRWLSSMRNLQKDDLAWAIHQRALAMAPKQEPEPSLLWDAEDPEDGTHASSAEDFARNYAEAAMSKGEVLDVSVLTAVHSRTRTMRIKVKDVDDGKWLEWEWLDGAAPAAANGAPELPALPKADVEGGYYDAESGFTKKAMQEYALTYGRAILAAAGPDAALIDERKEFLAFAHKDDYLGTLEYGDSGWFAEHDTNVAWKTWQARAALSGAKGN